MAGNQLTVQFWGVRGSYPVPGRSTTRYGGNTSCVEVRAGRHIIIFDAGTGIIELGSKLVEEIDALPAGDRFVINLLFSHTHHDHIQGLPYFAPAFHDNCTINIFGPKTFSHSIEEILALNMTAHYSPFELDEIAAELTFTNLNENHVLIFSEASGTPTLTTKRNMTKTAANTGILRVMKNYAHPRIGTFAARFEMNGKSVVYATDTEGYVGGDQRLIQFAQSTSLLIHDAQYDLEQYLGLQGFGHSTYEMAAQVAHAASAKQLALFHHDPTHSDEKLAEMETKAKLLFAETIMSAERLELKL